VDEAGRGPWAGPVVAAAVILEPSCVAHEGRRPWPSLGVKIDDSKRLTLAQRERAYPIILERAAVGVGIASSDTIDAVNIVQATLRAMAAAIDDLDARPDLVLVDGLHEPPVRIPCWTIVNGDRLSYSVACASIIAKVLRDSLMVFYHRLFPDYDFDRHKGYGTERHLDRLLALGPSVLHRMSFRPVRASASTQRVWAGDEEAAADSDASAVPMVVATSVAA